MPAEVPRWYSRWHWCFNAYLFVHESSDTRGPSSLLDLVVLFCARDGRAFMQCAREGTCPVQWYAAICHQCFCVCGELVLIRLCRPHTNRLYIPAVSYAALIRTPLLPLSWKCKLTDFLCENEAWFHSWWVCSVPTEHLCVCLELDLHTKM